MPGTIMKEMKIVSPGTTRRSLTAFYIVTLCGLNAIGYFLSIDGLGLYSDDWTCIALPAHSMEEVIAANLKYLLSQRPLDGLDLALLSGVLRAFGLPGAHVLLILPHVVSSIVLMFFFRCLLGERSALPFWGAAIFAVYPTDTSHGFFLTMFVYSLALLFFLASVVLFLRSYRNLGKSWAKGGSLACYLASLLSVEYAAFAVPFFVICYSLFDGAKGATNGTLNIARVMRNSLKATAPYVYILLIWALWWLEIVPFYGNQLKKDTIILSLPTIISNLLAGIKVSFLYPHLYKSVYTQFKVSNLGIDSLREVVSNIHQGGFLEFIKGKFSYFLGEGSGLAWMVSFLGMIIVALAGYFRRDQGKEAVFWKENLPSFCFLIVAGMGMTVLLYLPPVLGGNPPRNILGFSARINYLPGVGAVFAITGLLGVVTSCGRRFFPRRGQAVIAGILACSVAVFALFHYQVQRDFAESWRHQKRLLSSIRQACPDLKPGSTVLIDGIVPFDFSSPHKERPYIFSNWWAVSSALTMLYGHDLPGNILNLPGPPIIYPDGLYLYGGEKQKIPWYSYENIVFFTYSVGNMSVTMPESRKLDAVDGSLITVRSNTGNCSGPYSGVGGVYNPVLKILQIE